MESCIRKLALLLALLMFIGATTVNAVAAAPAEQFSGTTASSSAEETQPSIDDYPFEIPEGTKYYRSSYGHGSGRWGIVSDGNIYTDSPCYAGRDGYSWEDEKGRVLMSDYQEGVPDIEIPAPPIGATRLMVHFHGVVFRNGWIDNDNCTRRTANTEEIIIPVRKPFPQQAPLYDPQPNPEPEAEPEKVPGVFKTEEEQEVEEVAKEIGDIAQSENAKKTVLVIDFSGSMAPNQAEVLRLIETFDLDAFESIWVFASRAKSVTAQQLNENDFRVGSSTYMYKALNIVQENEPNAENIILISDLRGYGWEELAENSKIKNVTVYDPVWNDSTDQKELDAFAAAWPEASITWNDIEG